MLRKLSFQLVIQTVFCVICFPSFAQKGVMGGVESKGMDMNTFPGGTISTFSQPKPATVGSYYLFEGWQLGSLVTYSNDAIENYPFNVDLKHNQIEINTDQGVKVLPIRNVKTLKIYSALNGSQEFLNAKEIGGAKVQISGLVEKLPSDSAQVFKYYFLYLKEANYNAALDMGDEEAKIILKEQKYFKYQGQLMEIPKTNNKFASLFHPEAQKGLKNYMKENELSVKDDKDIARIFRYIRTNNVNLREIEVN